MEGTEVRRRLSWQLATVAELIDETRRVRTIALDLPGWSGHRAGQHVDVRLTTEDGYQAQRSYSIASAPEEHRLMLTVERLDDGEVSPYLVDELRVGDTLEMRGPIGGYFVWRVAMGGPLQLIAGGSGIVPLRSMLRYRDTVGSTVPAKLLYSARSLSDLIYREEIVRSVEQGGVDVSVTLTRERPNGWHGYARRIDRDLLAETCWPASEQPHVYVCGPTSFVETAASTVVALGHDSGRIRTERFGPSGS